jgi:hypothetical protein
LLSTAFSSQLPRDGYVRRWQSAGRPSRSGAAGKAASHCPPARTKLFLGALLVVAAKWTSSSAAIRALCRTCARASCPGLCIRNMRQSMALRVQLQSCMMVVVGVGGSGGGVGTSDGATAHSNGRTATERIWIQSPKSPATAQPISKRTDRGKMHGAATQTGLLGASPQGRPNGVEPARKQDTACPRLFGQRSHPSSSLSMQIVIVIEVDCRSRVLVVDAYGAGMCCNGHPICHHRSCSEYLGIPLSLEEGQGRAQRYRYPWRHRPYVAAGQELQQARAATACAATI